MWLTIPVGGNRPGSQGPAAHLGRHLDSPNIASKGGLSS